MPRKTKPTAAEKSSKIKATTDVQPAAFPKLRLPIRPPYSPMEACTAKEIPVGPEWIYEPKWDGFRCLAFLCGRDLALQSKAGQPLVRYFPELASALARLEAAAFVLDGEIVIEADAHLDFDALLQRIHPAVSRIQRLSSETPATLLCFDLLVDDTGESLVQLPLKERKKRLERFITEYVDPQTLGRFIKLSVWSDDVRQARRWMQDLRSFGCDGVMAKLKDEPYHPGDREATVKIKRLRSADCVVGGFRYAQKKEQGIGSLLLGLYNEEGKLDHVGFCSSFSREDRLALKKKLEPLVEEPGFTGKAPGGRSRWARDERSTEWKPLKPVLICEVQYDHFSGGRFRHGTKFLRWRPEKAPRSCTFEQLGTQVGILDLAS